MAYTCSAGDFGQSPRLPRKPGLPGAESSCKSRHTVEPSLQVFLEPEGRHSPEVYVQGFSTGLPERLQLALLHTLPGAVLLQVNSSASQSHHSLPYS